MSKDLGDGEIDRGFGDEEKAKDLGERGKRGKKRRRIQKIKVIKKYEVLAFDFHFLPLWLYASTPYFYPIKKRFD